MELTDYPPLFLLTRDYSDKGCIVREVGDFLAHPCMKDRGIVLNSINNLMTQFDDSLDLYFKGKADITDLPTFNGICPDELIRDLNNIFRLASIESEEITREDNKFRDFIFCTIFLLSTFKLKYKSQILKFEASYSHGLRLKVRCESNRHIRHYACLSILNLPNVWIECASVLRDPEHILERHIARRFKQGFIGAISYEQDAKDKIFDAKDFRRGELWPLPDNQ